MAWVALLDGNDVEQPAPAGLVAPNTLNIGHAAFLDLFPDQRRFHHALGDGVIRWWTAGPRASKDGIIAIIDVLHADHRLRATGAGVIARPFTKRPLGLAIIGIHEAFDDDFGMRRERQPGGFAFDNFDGRSLQATGVVEFRNAVV